MSNSFLLCAKLACNCGYIRVAGILFISQVCKAAYQYNFEVNWKGLLISHFPSYYILREQLFNLATSWKEEYIKAYHNLSLRYLNRANLNKSKVVHFGPTAIGDLVVAQDEEPSIHVGLNMSVIFGDYSEDNKYNIFEKITQEELTQHYLPFSCNKKLSHYFYKGGRFCMEGCSYIFENKIYMVDQGDQYIVALDLATNTVVWSTSLDVHDGNYAFLHYTLVMSRDRLYGLSLYNLFMCFDIHTGKKVWEHDIEDKAADVVAVENKVFLLNSQQLYCFDGATGILLFTHKVDHKHLDFYDLNVQLVIDGNYAIWMESHNEPSLVVFDWKLQQVTEVVNITEAARIKRNARFVVSNGICIIHQYELSKSSKGNCVLIAIKLNYAEIPSKESSDLVKRRKRPYGDVNQDEAEDSLEGNDDSTNDDSTNDDSTNDDSTNDDSTNDDSTNEEEEAGIKKKKDKNEKDDNKNKRNKNEKDENKKDKSLNNVSDKDKTRKDTSKKDESDKDESEEDKSEKEESEKSEEEESESDKSEDTASDTGESENDTNEKKKKEEKEGKGETEKNKTNEGVDDTQNERGNKNKSQLQQKLLWIHRSKSFDLAHHATLCVYGDMIFVFVRPSHRKAQIKALNLFNGEEFWSLNCTFVAEAIDFFVVEGTASLAERKKAIAQRDMNAGKQTMLIDGDDTPHMPVLHYHMWDDYTNVFHKYAINAYTGFGFSCKELERDKTMHVSTSKVSVAKYTKPLMLTFLS